jgi:hypothetical protein
MLRSLAISRLSHGHALLTRLSHAFNAPRSAHYPPLDIVVVPPATREDLTWLSLTATGPTLDADGEICRLALVALPPGDAHLDVGRWI